MREAMLRIRSGPLKGKGYSLPDTGVLIGRGSQCDIQLCGYRQLSRQHARVFWDGDGCAIEDLNSKNGTVVNGERISRRRVADGAVIQLGDLEAEIEVRAVPLSRFPARLTTAAAAIGCGVIAAILFLSPVTPSPGHDRPLSPSVMQASKDATVLVEAKVRGGSQVWCGTGFCALQPTLIITCKHVVHSETEEAEAVELTLRSGMKNEQKVEGKVVYEDPTTDLALIQIVGAVLKPLAIGNSADLKQTETCYALGFPAVRTDDISSASPEASVQDVKVQALRRDGKGEVEKVQLGGTLTHGNSGGPVINNRGEVIGVVAELAREDAGDGIAFAIATPRINDLWSMARASSSASP